MDEAIDNCQHGVKGEISPMKERTVMLFWTCMISLFCVVYKIRYYTLPGSQTRFKLSLVSD